MTVCDPHLSTLTRKLHFPVHRKEDKISPIPQGAMRTVDCAAETAGNPSPHSGALPALEQL